MLINKRSREDAERTRLNLKGKLTAKMDITGRVAKFVDCRSKDTAEREIFIVEGDSALGAVKQARDPNYQAIMPIRGKILNCLKADYDKIFKSEIITDLIKVLGCGVQVKTKANKSLATFDMDNLRWSKIILCTDADVDGFHIRTMLLTMLYRLTPDLIEQNKVFIAESPLYEITSKDKTFFAYNEREKEQFLEELKGQKYTIQRSKGLGENDPDMMNLTTMNPKTRRLIQVKPGDRRAHGADVRHPARRQPQRSEGLHRRARQRIYGRSGRFLTGANGRFERARSRRRAAVRNLTVKERGHGEKKNSSRGVRTPRKCRASSRARARSSSRTSTTRSGRTSCRTR